MRCKRVRKLLTAYTDGELAEEDRRCIAAHLAECKPCRECVDDVQKVLAWAGTWRDGQLSPDFLARVKARAGAAQERATAWFPLRLPGARTALAGLAAACLVFLLGYLAGVGFSGGKGPAAGSRPITPAAPGDAAHLPDAERLIVGVQKIKMVFGDKLSDAARAQLNEVQQALAAAGGVRAEAGLAVVKGLQQAEELIREKKFAEARQMLALLEASHPEHPLAPYASITKMLTTPQRPGYGSELLNSAYAMLLRDTVIDPAEFYSQLARLQEQATEYGWQKIVESADRLNPLNLLDYIEDRLASGSGTL